MSNEYWIDDNIFAFNIIFLERERERERERDLNVILRRLFNSLGTEWYNILQSLGVILEDCNFDACGLAVDVQNCIDCGIS